MSESDIFEDHDVISMTSYGHVTPSLTSPIDAPYGISYQVPIGQNPLDRFVSEIFRIKVAQKVPHTHTHKHADTLSNKQGRLKLAAREPIHYDVAATGACPDAAAAGSYACSTSVPRSAVSGKDSDEALLDLSVHRRWCFANSHRRLSGGGGSGNGDVTGCHVTQDLARVASDRPLQPCLRDVITQHRLLPAAASVPTSRSRTTILTNCKGTLAEKYAGRLHGFSMVILLVVIVGRQSRARNL